MSDPITVIPLSDETDPRTLLTVFNSNRDYLHALEGGSGKRQFEISDVEMHLWANSVAENSSVVLLTRGEAVLGTMAWVAPHPTRPHPWIGSVVVDRHHQGTGVGSQAVAWLEDRLCCDGWVDLGVSPMVASSQAVTFFSRRGFHGHDTVPDQDGRPCRIMLKELLAGPGVPDGKRHP